MEEIKDILIVNIWNGIPYKKLKNILKRDLQEI